MRDKNQKAARISPTSKHTSQGEKKQNELVRAAFDLIAERGFEGLRTRDVASRADVTVATLHYYFPTKEDLIRGVMATAMEQFRRWTAPPPDTLAQDPRKSMREVFQVRQRQMKDTPQLFIVLLELTARAARDPAIKAIMRESEKSWSENISSHLREGIEKGVFRPDLDVPAASILIEALTRGRSMLAIVNPDALMNDRVNAEIERWLSGRFE
jgi:AcrR family transcriptional regulator